MMLKAGERGRGRRDGEGEGEGERRRFNCMGSALLITANSHREHCAKLAVLSQSILEAAPFY